MYNRFYVCEVMILSLTQCVNHIPLFVKSDDVYSVLQFVKAEEIHIVYTLVRWNL